MVSNGAGTVNNIAVQYNNQLMKMSSNENENVKVFFENYINEQGNFKSNVSDVKEVDNEIENTRKAILFYKEELTKLSSATTNTTTNSTEDLVTKYINVMANIHYLRIAMTVFILLQEKKMKKTTNEGANANNELSKIKDLLPESYNKTNIDKYIKELQKENNDLRELLKTSLPLIVQIDDSVFPLMSKNK